MTVVIREMSANDALAFLQVHRAAVRGLAAGDYPSNVIDAWAPLPVTSQTVESVQANADGERRIIAELNGAVVGIGAIVVANSELRACYVRPEAARKGLGSTLVRALEEIAAQHGLLELRLNSSISAEAFYRACGYTTIGPGEHILRTGDRMKCIKMHKRLSGKGSAA